MTTDIPHALIGQLYDAAIDPRHWSGMADHIASAFDATSAVVKFHGDGGDVHLLQTTGNMIVPDRLQEWAEDWHRRDLWVQRSVSYGMNKIVTDDLLVTEDEKRLSGFYQEFLTQFDIHYLVGAAFSVGESGVGVLGIHRPVTGQAFSEVDEHKAAQLLPHLQRAMRLSQQLSQVEFLKAAALDALDHVDTGVVVIGRTGSVVYVNAQAEDLLQRETSIGVSQGRLYLEDPILNSRFLNGLREVLTVAAGVGRSLPAALVVPRPDRLPLTLSLTPLKPDWSRGFDHGPMAFVFLKDPEQAYDIGRLRELFGFTPTEAAIAADLGSGTAVDRIAERHHIGIGTVRFHLKRILAKTGTGRQAEVAALLARSVAALKDRG